MISCFQTFSIKNHERFSGKTEIFSAVRGVSTSPASASSTTLPTWSWSHSMSSQVSQGDQSEIFSGNNPEIFSAANVTITFATEQPDGVLFYFGDYQHLAVELFK